MCEVSKISVFNILTEYFDMSGVCARWVPRLVKYQMIIKKTNVDKLAHSLTSDRAVRLAYT
jgi:hypothetical protein